MAIHKCGISGCGYATMPGSSFCIDHYPEPKSKLEPDMVNHPPHYNMGKFEVIDIIIDKLGNEGAKNYCLGNVLKYTMRHEHKGNPIEDLEKAAWYLNKAIELEKAAE